MNTERLSYDQIVGLVDPGASVLDLGCGDGSLLERLIRERGVRGRGVEIEEAMIRECIAKGISVFQGNLDEGLQDYDSQTYDFVILNQTIQVVHEPVLLLKEMIRVGRRVIVGFPNFGFLVNRIQLGFFGHMPKHRSLPYEWYNTPNIHLCTRKDFHELCDQLNIRVHNEICFSGTRRVPPAFSNLFARSVYFVLSAA